MDEEPITPEEYRIVRATPEDRGRILDFMRLHFYRYEPLSVSLGMTDGPSCPDKIFSLSSLQEGMSLLALAPGEVGGRGEEIVGICLNGEEAPQCEREPKKDLATNCTCPKYAKMLTLLAMVDQLGHVWKSTGADKMLDIHVLAVDSGKRRVGLGRALIEHTIKLAKKRGYPALSMHCTSHYSASLAQKLGMRCVYMVRYDEYLDQSGYPVFNPPPPHAALTSYVHLLN